MSANMYFKTVFKLSGSGLVSMMIKSIDLLQQILAINMLTALKSSEEHCIKHVL